MLPPVHLVVGYVCYAAYSRLVLKDLPRAWPALAAVAGAAIPDLLDKPLWLSGVVPVGRTIGHSLLFAIPASVAVWVVARGRDHNRNRDRDLLGVAFVVGLLSHVATDVPWHLLSREYHELGFLLWPITHMPEYTGTKSLGTVGGLEVTTLWLEAVVVVGGIALWWRDGRPGLENVRSALPV
ncbi:metal-dependent hydrolase [Halomontanus rarus]|uniref:metal-dependent hydrolase n=1 Tax=Halomontanus rarus TaxID=3034020 RepID=UPI0023E765B8|nr:metal-dependent hydrolase [Halovivax sp. TS33]